MTYLTSPDPGCTRNRDGFRQLGIDMCRALPPTEDPSPAARARRDDAAIAIAAALRPGSVAEASLAVQHVIAASLALESARRSLDPALSAAQAMRLYAQSVGLMRQSQTTLRALERMQAARAKCDPASGEVDRSDWIEDRAAAFMRGSEPPPAPAEPAEDPHILAAEAYATAHPERAALIRHLGRVPDDVSFDPPADTVVLALVIGETPVLQQVDALMAPRIADGSLLRVGPCHDERNFESMMGLTPEPAL